MFDLLEIIPTFALINIHVNMPRATALFPKQNGDAGPRNLGNLHAMSIPPLHHRLVIARAELDFKVVVEAIDEVAAFGLGVIGKQAYDAEVVAGAGNDLPIDVVRLQRDRPGIGPRPARRQLAIVVADVQSGGQSELAHLV